MTDDSTTDQPMERTGPTERTPDTSEPGGSVPEKPVAAGEPAEVDKPAAESPEPAKLVPETSVPDSAESPDAVGPEQAPQPAERDAEGSASADGPEPVIGRGALLDGLWPPRHGMSAGMRTGAGSPPWVTWSTPGSCG
jgi:hypothetical protein